jgi:hypothetical protein
MVGVRVVCEAGLMNAAATTTAAGPQTWGPGFQIALLGVFVSCAAMLLYSIPLVRPVLVVDDFQILLASWTWDATVQNLWVSNNEHAMPLGRLTTWLVVILSGNMARLPFVAGLQGLLALLVGMWLVYLLVKRELGHPFFGLVAMAFFGVTTIYQQAVYWFAASFSLLALDTLLLGLLAAQSWRRSRRWQHILLTVLCAFLAPMWFASGVLVGPLLSLYLLVTPRNQPEAPATKPPSRWWAAVPLLSTVAFLAISLPLTARQIMHLEHYGDETALQAFRPGNGILHTGHAMIENLVLGTFGISGVVLPVVVDFGLLIALILALSPWWRKASRPDLLVLGLAMILLSYLLTYSARGAWDWGEMGQPNFTLPNWSRYHLFPQLGLVLMVLAIAPRWQNWLGDLRADGRLSDWQRRLVVFLALILLLIHLPRGIAARWKAFEDFPWQQGQLTWIDNVETVCRRERVAAESVKSVLPACPIHLGPERGCQDLDFVRGSPDPLPWTKAEVRTILATELHIIFDFLGGGREGQDKG